jgi:hypothetical protein
MGILSAFLPTKRYLRYAREFSLALSCALVAVVEIRDMYERSQWEHVGLQGTTSTVRTGDVVLIANRWFTLPSWRHKFYSLMSKQLMKTTWDDCGIIICDPNDNYKPYILLVEYDRVVMCGLNEFCEHRQPRGVSVRSLVSPDPSKPLKIPHLDRLESWVKEILKRPEEGQQQQQQQQQTTAVSAVEEGKNTNNNNNNSSAGGAEEGKEKQQIFRQVTPWSVARAAWQTDAERAQYRWAVESSELAFEIKQKRAEDAATEQALGKLTDKLHDRIALQEHYEKALGPEPARPYNKLFNASLVAEALQEAGLLTRPYPFAFRYTPVDFAWRVPLINVNLTQPKMVFTS